MFVGHFDRSKLDVILKSYDTLIFYILIMIRVKHFQNNSDVFYAPGLRDLF